MAAFGGVAPDSRTFTANSHGVHGVHRKFTECSHKVHKMFTECSRTAAEAAYEGQQSKTLCRLHLDLNSANTKTFVDDLTTM